MSTAPQYQPISVRDYLDGEETAKRKHEYVDGVVYAMTGGTPSHSSIAVNSIIALGIQLRGQKCRVFNSDMKIRVRMSQGIRFYYPDVSVVCQPNPRGDVFQDAPVAIIEVISESTRRTDESEKREAYLSIPSLRVYILVEQASAYALAYRRSDSGFEREAYVGLDAVIPLPEVNCSLALADIFQNVEFQPLPSEDDLEEG